jgi:hypothetical protein
MVGMAKRAGLPWDAILGAEVVRAYKPSPQVYADTPKSLDLAQLRFAWSRRITAIWRQRVNAA